MKIDFSSASSLGRKLIKEDDNYVYLVGDYENNKADDAVFLGECKTMEEAWNILKNYLDEIGQYYTYYSRYNYYGDVIEVDFGSYSKFAYIYDLDEDQIEYIKLKKEVYYNDCV